MAKNLKLQASLFDAPSLPSMEKLATSEAKSENYTASSTTKSAASSRASDPLACPKCGNRSQPAAHPQDHEGKTRYCIFCVTEGEPFYFSPGENNEQKRKSDLPSSAIGRRRVLPHTEAGKECNIDIDRAENDRQRCDGMGSGAVVQLHSQRSESILSKREKGGASPETNMGAVSMQSESSHSNERDSSIHGLASEREDTASNRSVRDENDMGRSLAPSALAKKEVPDNDGSILDLFGNPIQKESSGALADRFLVPPFSILDARQGYWKSHKAEWLAMGITSADGRCSEFNVIPGGGEPNSAMRRVKQNSHKGPLHKSETGKEWGEEYQEGEDAWRGSGASIFDPVLCELAYRWFAPPAGKILDPFAGGSVRGIVAEKLGYHYTGIELRPEQIAANCAQAANIGVWPNWIQGDSLKMNQLVPALKYEEMFDMVFTCPPYYDLEEYSESNEDGSAKQTYAEFLAWYKEIFRHCKERLKWNRFLVVVVGEIRDNEGFYRNFVGDTISCMLSLGFRYYNEAILVTAIGSLPLRVNGQFGGYRKLGKTHQNVLVFYNGKNCDQIAEKFGKLL